LDLKSFPLNTSVNKIRKGEDYFNRFFVTNHFKTLFFVTCIALLKQFCANFFDVIIRIHRLSPGNKKSFFKANFEDVNCERPNIKFSKNIWSNTLGNAKSMYFQRVAIFMLFQKILFKNYVFNL
jgi:hypothetical protein